MIQSKDTSGISNEIKIAEFTPLEFNRITAFKKVIVKYKLKLAMGETNPQLDEFNALIDGSTSWKILSETPPIADRSGAITQMFTLISYM